MCLYVDRDKTIDILTKFHDNANNNGMLTFYKIFTARERKLYSPFQFTEVKLTGFKEFVSNRAGSHLSSFERSHVDRGIHAFSSLKAAQLYLNNKWEGNRKRAKVIVPVLAKRSDFVAAGRDGDVVFTKIYIYNLQSHIDAHYKKKYSRKKK